MIIIIKEYNVIMRSLRNLVKLTINVVFIFLGQIFWWAIARKLSDRPNFEICRRLYKNRPWHPGLVLVHCGSVEHCLVISIAQYLSIQIHKLTLNTYFYGPSSLISKNFLVKSNDLSLKWNWPRGQNLAGSNGENAHSNT